MTASLDCPSWSSFTSFSDWDRAVRAYLANSPMLAEWLDLPEPNYAGPNLEYTPEFLQLSLALDGQPESQFQAALPPDWLKAAALAQSLLQQSRDVRLLLAWMRAQLPLQGMSLWPAALNVLTHWFAAHWNSIHPELDGDDAFSRIKELVTLDQHGAFLKQWRQQVVIKLPVLGDIQLRHFAYALDKLPAHSDLELFSKSQLQNALRAHPAPAAQLMHWVQELRQALSNLTQVLQRHVPTDELPTFTQILDSLGWIEAFIPFADSIQPELAQTEHSTSVVIGSSLSEATAVEALGFATTGLTTREDALRLIEAVCKYLDLTEPSNPAQWFLRRAQRLLNKNFIELVQELAPDSLPEVGRLMGVDPQQVLKQSTDQF